MNIKLVRDKKTDNCFFLIDFEDLITFSSEGIACKFKLSQQQYLSILVKEVIRHGHYSIKSGSSSSDILFKSRGVSVDAYVERFKEAFAPQLILVSLDGGSLC